MYIIFSVHFSFQKDGNNTTQSGLKCQQCIFFCHSLIGLYFRSVFYICAMWMLYCLSPVSRSRSIHSCLPCIFIGEMVSCVSLNTNMATVQCALSTEHWTLNSTTWLWHLIKNFIIRSDTLRATSEIKKKNLIVREKFDREKKWWEKSLKHSPQVNINMCHDKWLI